MTTVLKSGRSGYTATVNSNERLLTSSEGHDVEGVRAHTGDAFVMYGMCHLAAATSGGFLYFTNTDSTHHIHITRILIDAHSLSDNIIIHQVKNPDTVTGGTDVSTTNLVNKNFGSGTTTDGTLVMSDGSSDMTYTGGTRYHSLPIGSLQSKPRDMRGTNIVTNAKTILWGWETVDGGNAVDGEIISFSVNYYKELST